MYICQDTLITDKYLRRFVGLFESDVVESVAWLDILLDCWLVH